MLNKKILKFLDNGDMFIQKTKFGVTIYSIGENASKEYDKEDGGGINPYALDSISFNLENDLGSADIKEFDSFLYNIKNIVDDWNSGIKIRTYKSEDSLLRIELEDWQKYNPERLEEILKEYGYVKEVKNDNPTL